MNRNRKDSVKIVVFQQKEWTREVTKKTTNVQFIFGAIATKPNGFLFKYKIIKTIIMESFGLFGWLLMYRNEFKTFCPTVI